eukprot:jgi/Hompol1/2788/HPOL_000380-RA
MENYTLTTESEYSLYGSIRFEETDPYSQYYPPNFFIDPTTNLSYPTITSAYDSMMVMANVWHNAWESIV